MSSNEELTAGDLARAYEARLIARATTEIRAERDAALARAEAAERGRAGGPPMTDAAKMPTGWCWEDETQSFYWSSNFIAPGRLQSLAVSLERIRALLATQGLHVVSAKDMAVLEACAAVPDEVLHSPIVHAEQLYPLCDAIQLDRRESK